MGGYLKTARRASGLTLRRVEDLSEGRIKNGYLSQVEGGFIKVPSTKVLYELASIYGVDYTTLLRLAGLPTGGPEAEPEEARIAGLPTRALADLTEAESRRVLEFVAFVRSQRPR